MVGGSFGIQCYLMVSLLTWMRENFLIKFADGTEL